MISVSFHCLEDMETLELQNESSSSSSSNSIDSNNYLSRTPPQPSSSSSSSSCMFLSKNRTDLSTDLRLGLSISPSPHSQSPRFNSTTREETYNDWPPIKSILRRSTKQSRPSLFVKVYMEGIPIGRKLNLLAHHSYDGLLKTLSNMFRTIILCPNSQPLNPGNFHVLTYEDQEGDWMMVGDVPWEMFLSSVKRLKITRADSC